MVRLKRVNELGDSWCEMVLDVVCNMEVDEKTKWKSEYKGKTYYFCAPGCKQRFDRNPEKYVK